MDLVCVALYPNCIECSEKLWKNYVMEWVEKRKFQNTLQLWALVYYFEKKSPALPHPGFFPVPGLWLCVWWCVWQLDWWFNSCSFTVCSPLSQPREAAVWFYQALVLSCVCWCSRLSSGWDRCFLVSGTSLLVEWAKRSPLPKAH